MPRLTASLSATTYRQVCALAEEAGLKPNDWVRSLILHEVVFKKGPDWIPLETDLEQRAQTEAIQREEDIFSAEADPETVALLNTLLGVG